MRVAVNSLKAYLKVISLQLFYLSYVFVLCMVDQKSTFHIRRDLASCLMRLRMEYIVCLSMLEAIR